MIFKRHDNCKICAHYLSDQTCQAFPKGIPEPLWLGKNLHQSAYTSDQGYRFQGKPLDAPPPLDEDEMNEFEDNDLREAA
jgi:hypothetical protein